MVIRAQDLSKLVNIDQTKMTKCENISQLQLGCSVSTNDSYWLEHNWIVLLTYQYTKVDAMYLVVRWLLPFFHSNSIRTSVQFLPRLGRRVQMYHSRSRFTSSSMAQDLAQSTGHNPISGHQWVRLSN